MIEDAVWTEEPGLRLRVARADGMVRLTIEECTSSGETVAHTSVIITAARWQRLCDIGTGFFRQGSRR